MGPFRRPQAEGRHGKKFPFAYRGIYDEERTEFWEAISLTGRKKSTINNFPVGRDGKGWENRSGHRPRNCLEVGREYDRDNGQEYGQDDWSDCALEQPNQIRLPHPPPNLRC